MTIWDDLREKYADGENIGVVVGASPDGTSVSIVDRAGETLLRVILQPEYAYNVAASITHNTIKVEEHRKGLA